MAQEIRLYVATPLWTNANIHLSQEQSHYLANVMRVKTGDMVSVFNGIDGQWQAEVTSVMKKAVSLSCNAKAREQTTSPDLWLAFAPLKNKTELVVEKAVELGVSKLIPIVTRHAVVRSVNMEKLEIHAIEAAEQCERLDIPTLETHKDLSYLLSAWPKDRALLYGDESGGGKALGALLPDLAQQKIGVLIGPEGGFAREEFEMLRACDFAKPFGMGPRILRADTAAVAALACVQMHRGDWRLAPHFRAES
jgi:16S rRNA (uracil1498-N3)-methyltransferase